MAGKTKVTRRSLIRPPDVVFLHVERFSAQLLTYKDVTGIMRWQMENPKSNILEDKAVKELL